MQRIKIKLPEHFNFSTFLPVRITDINYGGHVGNDKILALIHEARVLFLHSFGYTELELEGVGLIMSDVGIVFKSELFYGDQLMAFVKAADFNRAGFDVYYKFEIDGKLIASAKTGMVCYDYKNKKLAGLPERVRELLGRG